MRSALLTCLSLLLIGCPAGPGGGAASATVTPMTLDFGTIEVGDWQILELEIRNSGTSQLNVTSATIADEGPFTSGGAEMQLRANETATISVSFQPSEPGEYASTLVFETNAPREPLFEIPLSGIAQAAALGITPEELDLGPRIEGCTTSRTITLNNSGDAPLLGLEVSLSGDDEGLSLLGADAPIDIDPGGSVELTLTWVPTEATAIDAQIVVEQGNDTLASLGVTGQSTAMTTTEDAEFDVPEVSEIDFLWVIDTGLTMDTVQMRIGNGGFELMSELEDQFYDWRFAVVSADGSGNGEMLASVIDTNTTDPGADFIAAVTQSGSTNPGLGMQMAWEALNSPNTDVGAPNQGILRPGAGLAIIFVSTGVDQSTMLNGSGEAFRDAFIALKSDPAMISISVVSGGENGCTTGSVAASSTPEYLAAEWRGQVQSVCTNPIPLWPMTYSGPHQRSAFPLSPPALASSIAVTVTPDGGKPAVSTDFTYDTDNDWLVFDEGSLPPANAEVDVAWAPADVCGD